MSLALLIPLIPSLLATVKEGIVFFNGVFRNKEKSGAEKSRALIDLVEKFLRVELPKGTDVPKTDVIAAFVEGVFQVMKASGEVDGEKRAAIPAQIPDIPGADSLIGTQVVVMQGKMLVVTLP